MRAVFCRWVWRRGEIHCSWWKDQFQNLGFHPKRCPGAAALCCPSMASAGFTLFPFPAQNTRCKHDSPPALPSSPLSKLRKLFHLFHLLKQPILASKIPWSEVWLSIFSFEGHFSSQNSRINSYFVLDNKQVVFQNNWSMMCLKHLEELFLWHSLPSASLAILPIIWHNW